MSYTFTFTADVSVTPSSSSMGSIVKLWCAMTARLLNRGGGKMADLPLQAGQSGLADIELPLSSLAAGDYLIEINAKTESGTAQELIAFKVGR